jgi:hypothetical protein
MTPAKYTALMAYRKTGEKTRLKKIIRQIDSALTEDPFIVNLFDDEPQTGREHADKDVQVKEERHPGGRLMLRDGGDDRDVDLGVARVPE